MEGSKREKDLQWMEDLARKHGISLETVQGFFDSVNGRGTCFKNKRQRTESFFDLYFEGVKEGKENDRSKQNTSL